MPRLTRLAFALLLSSIVAGHASADEYTIAVGTPQTGTLIPPGRVGLGIPVNIDKPWAQLAPADQLAWREFTELVDPQVTPPFPKPNIRAFLHKLELPTGLVSGQKLTRSESMFLVVHISEEGEVNGIDIMHGGTEGATALTDYEQILAHRYIKALNATKFTPAMVNGQAAPCAIPLHLSWLTITQ